MDKFERQYKEHLSGFNEWDQLDHAEEWMVFERNVGERLSIDETSLSKGELYTIITNKDESTIARKKPQQKHLLPSAATRTLIVITSPKVL